MKSSQRLSMQYIPDGLTKQQWESIQSKEMNERKSNGNLGAVGIQKFKSRSMQAMKLVAYICFQPILKLLH